MPRRLWDAMKEPAVLFLLASSRCPGTVIILGLDVAVALKDAPVSIASGFQSPLEKESLKFLLKGSVRLVICPARSAVGMRVPEAWKLAIAANRLSIRSAIDEGFESQRHAAQPDKAPRRPTALSLSNATASSPRSPTRSLSFTPPRGANSTASPPNFWRRGASPSGPSTIPRILT